MKLNTQILSFLLLIVLSFNSYAQVPQGFNYQAIARDNTGNVLPNQAISIRISILDSSSSGQIIYSETHSKTTNDFGLFTLTIGNGITTGDFSLIDWSTGKEKWVKIEMDASGGSNYTLMGTSQLLSVPFAMFALNASNGSSQWNSVGNGIFYNSGNVGIGTNIPDSSAALEVKSVTQGFLPPVMTEQQRNAIISPAVGLVIFNSTSGCINVFKSTGWWEICGNCITPNKPSASNNGPVCEGDSLMLFASATAGVSYSWSGPNGFSSTLQNPIIQNVLLVDSGIYTVSVSNSCGASAPNSTIVDVNPLPNIANAGNDQIGVSGNTTTLTANTAINGSGIWSIASGLGGIIANLNNPISSFLGVIGNTYELVWTISNTCASTSDTVEISFAVVFNCGDTLIDMRDGKKYATVQIGTQCWMAENLNYGAMINGSNNQTNNSVAEKYCYYNDTCYCDTFGGMYQWNETMQYTTTQGTQGVCPLGWHVPTDYEFIVLEIYLGMTSSQASVANSWRGTNQGTKLKLGGSSGYNALLCGRMTYGSSYALYQYEYMWTSSEYVSTLAWRRCLRTNDATVGRWNTFPKDYSFSIRCVKN